MNHVIMSVGLVQGVVRTVSSEHLVTILVVKDILAQTVRGSVHLTVNLTHVYTQTDHVPCVLQAGWDIIVLQLALKDILAKTVRGSVHQTVDLTHVYTQTDHVLCVLQDGRVIIVLQHASNLMEETVSTYALRTVTIRHVTGLTDAVF